MPHSPSRRLSSPSATSRARCPTEGALHSPVDAVEEIAELGLGGVSPVFADERFPEDLAHDTGAADTVPP